GLPLSSTKMNDISGHIDLELDALLHPARAFNHPDDVVSDISLTLNEKRAILASWASDACAVDAAAALRRAPGGKQIVSVDEILEALRVLDKQVGERGASWARRQVRRMSIEVFRARRTPTESISNNGLNYAAQFDHLA